MTLFQIEALQQELADLQAKHDTEIGGVDPNLS